MFLIPTVLCEYYSFRRKYDKIYKVNWSDPNYDVVVNFVDRNETEALYTLVVNTSASASDKEQAYIAGYAEGEVTAHLI